MFTACLLCGAGEAHGVVESQRMRVGNGGPGTPGRLASVFTPQKVSSGPAMGTDPWVPRG